jgi:NAD(P)-dependent dehydrogenase (short-subunit alcohol dehydrogenase family)
MVPVQTGKVAVVTGANSGVGYHVALQLARRGARVYLACRNEQRALAAIEQLKTDLKELSPESEITPDLRCLHLDLNNLNQTAEAAQQLIESEPQIHILVNNAGIMALPYALTEDKIESQFGVNHVAPTLFTQLLLPTIRNSGSAEEPARIIFTASMGHQWSYSENVRLTLEAINDESSFNSMKAYGQSKLANILTASYMARQEEKSDGKPSVLVNSLHPGVVQSEIGRNLQESYGRIVDMGNRFFYSIAGMSAADGALTTLYAATSNKVKEKGYNGKYFVPYGKLATPNGPARDIQLQDKLWDFTQTVISEKVKPQKY